MDFEMASITKVAENVSDNEEADDCYQTLNEFQFTTD